MEKLSAASVVNDLKKLSSPAKARASAWFFKTGPGQYGHGDVFIGVTVPEQRLVARRYRGLPLAEVKKLIMSPIHEHRLTGLIILTEDFARADTRTRAQIARWYLAHTRRVNNWDLVDTSAPRIIGTYLRDNDSKIDRNILYKLAMSENIWERRIAIVSTLAFIVENDFVDALKIAEMLLDDTHDLIHKAVGWMLREVGKRSERTLTQFLDTHAAHMPRTSLRYAIERLSPAKKKRYMSVSVLRSKTSLS